MSKKQNTFLTGYFSVLALGAVGLGYLAWSSYAASTEAAETYESTKAKLVALQKSPVFPNIGNVEAKKKQVDAYTEKVRELNNTLKAYQTPVVENPDNSEFQKALQIARDSIATDAKNANVKLPDNFDLGMGTYLSTFPQTSAVPRLTAWLEGIVYVTRTLIDNGVTEISLVSRPELPFEKKPAGKEEETAKPKAAPKPAPAPKGKAKVEAPAPVVLEESVVLERNPFSISFTASNRALNEFLTILANTSPDAKSPFFFNIRVLRIENEQKTGADTSTQIAVQEEVDEGTQKPFKRDSAYIFGVEKLHVFLTIDLIRFPDPVAPQEKK